MKYKKWCKWIYTKWNKRLNLHNKEEYQTLVDKRTIAILEKEIQFLKTEICSKNETINKLLNNNTQKNNHNNMEGEIWGVFLQYNWLQLDKAKNKWKISYKEITKNTAYTAQAHISLLSQTEQWKKSWEGVDTRGKKWIYVSKAKERKQYQNNGNENLFVVIIYLIEVFKMRLLSIAGSFESQKRSNLTFKWLGKF